MPNQPAYARNYNHNALTDHDENIMVDLQLTQRYNKKLSLQNIKAHVPTFEGTTYNLDQDSINKIATLVTESNSLSKNHLETHCEDLGYEDAFSPLYLIEPEKQPPSYNLQTLMRNYFQIVGKETPSKNISKEIYKLVSIGRMGETIRGWQDIKPHKYRGWAAHIRRVMDEDPFEFFFNEEKERKRISAEKYKIEAQKKEVFYQNHNRYNLRPLSEKEMSEIIDRELARIKHRMTKVAFVFKKNFESLSEYEIEKKLRRYVISIALISGIDKDDIFCENISDERSDHLYIPLPVNSVGLVAAQVYLDLKYDNLSIFSHNKNWDIFNYVGFI